MRIPKIPLLLAPLFLAACASSSTQQAVSVPASVSPSPVVSVEAKPPEPTPLIDPIKVFGEVDLDGIEPKLIAKQAKLNIQLKTQSSQDCRLTMQYPTIFGLADITLQAQLNDSLRQEMMAKMNAPEVMLDGDRCKNVSQKLGKSYTYTNRCGVHFAEESLVSISCLNFTMPGASPVHRVYSVTFDLVVGKIYRLADLFKPDSNYTVKLAFAMHNAWLETTEYIVSPSFESLEARPSFDFYFQARCDERYQKHPKSSRRKIGSFPKVCMIIPNLGISSRNYRMPVRLGGIKDKLDTSGALKVWVGKID